MIGYFRLNIEYLWNAVDLEKTENSDSLNFQFSIINSQFPDKTGFPLRSNRLVRHLSGGLVRVRLFYE